MKQIECVRASGRTSAYGPQWPHASIVVLASFKGTIMATIDTRVAPNGKVSFRARARLKGYPQQTASFARKTDARKWAAGVEAAMREGRHFATSAAKRHTFGELIERYQREVVALKSKNARNQTQQLAWWKTQLGVFRLADVTPAKIGECRDQLRDTSTARGKRRSPATVVRYLAVLSHAYTVALKEWGWVDDNPLRKVSKPREPRGGSGSLPPMNSPGWLPRAQRRRVPRSIRSSCSPRPPACGRVRFSI